MDFEHLISVIKFNFGHLNSAYRYGPVFKTCCTHSANHIFFCTKNCPWEMNAANTLPRWDNLLVRNHFHRITSPCTETEISLMLNGANINGIIIITFLHQSLLLKHLSAIIVIKTRLWGWISSCRIIVEKFYLVVTNNWRGFLFHLHLSYLIKTSLCLSMYNFSFL